ncbi:flagellar hook-length control protein FliK [Methylobacterium soli]|uniref:Flagellar hook-length control protein FliK n=1 Tax=Methylobacterium soli TaxID=553447 RepID=A0A6L3T700_9HYPH|nr:flagellar hook-length control protein FliK [Methylobacterium soli]
MLGLLGALTPTPPPAQHAGAAAAPSGQGAPQLPTGTAAPATGPANAQAAAIPAGGPTVDAAGKAGDPVAAGPRRLAESGDPVAPGEARPEAGANPIDFAAALADASPPPPADPRGVKEAAAAAPTHAPSASERAPAQASPAPIQIGQVPLTIGLRSLAGSSQFEIRLDPGDLGRIDVKLDIDKERGTVMTHLVVERVETLQMLQRDAGSLQQALSQAGLDPSEGGINLSLRGDSHSSGGNAEQRDGQSRGNPARFGDVEARGAIEAVPLRSLRGLTGLDIRI